MNRLVVKRAAGLGVALFCFPCPRAYAEAPPTEVEEITVVETARHEAEVLAPSVHVSTIEIPDLEGPIESTPDLLSQAVGVQVQRFGGLGAFTTISIRGSASNQVPIFLDGVPLSQAQDLTVNLSDLPLDSLERIEVYRGAVPVGFGGGGVGGVVNLVSRAPSETPETEISVAGGSFGTRKLVATHRRKIGEHSVLAHISYLGSKGDFRYFDDNGTPENPSDDGRTTRINNDFDTVEALLKTSSPIGDRLMLDLFQEGFFREQGVAGPGDAQFARPSLLSARSLTYLRLRGDRIFDDTVDGDIKLFGVYNLQNFNTPDPRDSHGTLRDTRNQSAFVGINTSGTWFASRTHALTWFLQVGYERLFQENDGNAVKRVPDQSRLSVAAALQDEISLLDDRISLLPSVRYEHLRDRTSAADNSNTPETDPETTRRDLWNPSLGVVVRPTSWLSLRGNIARLTRPPSFSELFGNSGSTLGNANLKPETATNRDVGFAVQWQAPDQLAWLDSASFEYVYFDNDIRDLISFELASPVRFRAFNIESARVSGHEVSVSVEALDHLDVAVNFTHQDAENLDIDSREGNQLPLRPSTELFARPRIFGDWGSLYYEFTYLSENPIDRDNFNVTPSRTIHTIGGTWKPVEWLTAKLEVANLADQDIRDLGDFPLPGISVFGGLSAEF